MVSTHDNFARLLSLSCKILHNEGVMCATSPFIIVFTWNAKQPDYNEYSCTRSEPHNDRTV